MTDRELLEKAAKVLDMPMTDNGVRNLGQWEWLYCGDKEWGLYANNANGTQRRWNPLLSDGDALRLAVKLSLRIDAGYCGCADVRGYMVEATEALGHDACAATRRAIVRAAAEMADSKTPNAELSGVPAQEQR